MNANLLNFNGAAFLLFILICYEKTSSSASQQQTNEKKLAKVWSRINLPQNHMPHYFFSHKSLRKKCLNDENCPYREEANATKCWGYEQNCNKRDFLVQCPDDSKGWTTSKKEQIDLFWKQGDFGYVKERLSELKTYCKANEPGDSSLECVDHTRMCRGKNLYFDFDNLNSASSHDRYREDTFKPGQVGGKCEFDAKRFKQQGDHKSPLQSWYSELQMFESFEKKPIESNMCDIVINEPTILIKLDAGVNMYHHFCDFINLYVTQHFNSSFSQNVRIVFYDTSSHDYWSYFSEMWKVFSNKKPIHLKSWDKKKVCFRDVVFSFLARMRYGLYYNMPLVYGCHSTSLFRAFSEHVLHRFKIKQEGPLETKLRVTLLARGTQFRNILNQDKIIKELNRKLKNKIDLKLVTYDASTSFVEQIKQTHNTDIFMSMHGAGLTHLLFLPHWAAVFEIYNCDDKDCYLDLARLRGVKYFTWENESLLYPQDEGMHPQLKTPHRKFTNFNFDTKEFTRIVEKMIEYVLKHPEFIQAHQAKFNNKNKEEDKNERVEL